MSDVTCHFHWKYVVNVRFRRFLREVSVDSLEIKWKSNKREDLCLYLCISVQMFKKLMSHKREGNKEIEVLVKQQGFQ